MPIRTLCDLFYHSVDTFRKPEHLRYKRDGAWKGISSEELRQAVEELSMGLRSLGLEKGGRAAILSENRPEWAMADLATLTAAAVVTPIYATLMPAQVLYILRDCGATVAFASNETQAKKILEVRAQAPALRHVVLMEEKRIEGTLTLAEVRDRGRPLLEKEKDAVRKRAAEVKPEDLATLIYTSGTTGDPKGVMLVHSNLVSNVLSARKVFAAMGTEDVCLSFLPLCHVFERMAGYYLMLNVGATIAYAESVEKVPENMAEVQPTLMCSVPRLYEKMYARVNEKVANDPPKRQQIFRWAMAVGREVFRHRVERTSAGLLLRLKFAVADALVFSKIKARTGGRLKLFVSGGAPLAREIAEFFGAAGLTILEGYGLTETSPVITVNRIERLKPGSVGLPLEGVEVRIAEDGEILTRGPHVMKGYYNKPEATAETIDKDGWLHTGDVGVIDADGFLIITDRKKDILVTSGGKNIAPQPIENRLKTNKYFTEIVMVGNKRNYPVALIVPNFESLERWAREKGVPFASREELVDKPEVTEHYKLLINEMSTDLAQFERIKKVAVLPREFTIEAGELTPTLKVRRRVIEEKFKVAIDRLYGSGVAGEA
ncbi:MAG TPA: long-chain fatty acid--CoA ligase [Vicinamibacteria bacterium]|nr:long-chain fatty acid--CoA ligase [Vicinamibacteria bacterium]